MFTDSRRDQRQKESKTMNNNNSMYMNLGTGSVDTMENWEADSVNFCTEETNAKDQLKSLVEVVLDADGGWVEV